MTQRQPRWLGALNADPLPWLLEMETPAVRHVALRDLCDLAPGDVEVAQARQAAMDTDPIRAILAAQDPQGWWVKPGAGYSPKYRSTVWQVMFLDQLGADGNDPRVRKACEYVLRHTQTSSGGFGSSGAQTLAAPPPSAVIHCLNGNLTRALIGLGWLDDERVAAAIDWQARAITGDVDYFRSGTSGPGFCCAANDHLPCGWGAVKAIGALARVPAAQRSPAVRKAVKAGAAFLLSRDPAVADYPMGWGNMQPNRSWFKLGFPSGYVADVLQNLEFLAELGYGHDKRVRHAIEWVLSKQNAAGRWHNEYAYQGKLWTEFDRQAQPSKWVTLRACRLLKAVVPRD